MTKQEEIKEGIKKIAYNYTCTVEADDFITDEILQYLHSQGVVINISIKQGEDLTGCCLARLEPLVEPYKEKEGD